MDKKKASRDDVREEITKMIGTVSFCDEGHIGEIFSGRLSDGSSTRRKYSRILTRIEENNNSRERNSDAHPDRFSVWWLKGRSATRRLVGVQYLGSS